MRPGQKHKLESIEKMRLAMIGRKLTLEHRLKCGQSLKGHITKPETRIKISQALKGRHFGASIPGCRHTYTEEGLKRIRKSNRNRTLTADSRQKMSSTKKKHWKESWYVSKQMEARNIKPNKAELYLQDILDMYFPNEWKFVGDGQLVIGGKCPDFANVNGRKTLIELFGNYWHRNDNPEERIDLFKNYGYNTLIIWEDELKNEKTLVQKISEWVRR